MCLKTLTLTLTLTLKTPNLTLTLTRSVPEKPAVDQQQWRRVRVNQERVEEATPVPEATSVPEDAALTSGRGVGEATSVTEDPNPNPN